jgi:hypothetical protein
MKKAKVSFRVIGDSGPLSISWFQGPKGDAVEAKNQIGVGFFSTDGELLSVEFDDVEQRSDHQVLEFDRYTVAVTVKQGKVSFELTPKLPVRQHGRKKKATPSGEAA